MTKSVKELANQGAFVLVSDGKGNTMFLPLDANTQINFGNLLDSVRVNPINKALRAESVYDCETLEHLVDSYCPTD